MIDKGLREELTELYCIFFDSDFFLQRADNGVRQKIENEIKSFLARYPKLQEEYHTRLTSAMPDFKLEDWTQFFNWDRCIRFLVEKQQGKDFSERYMVQVSIFGYFSVCHAPMKFMNGKYIHGRKRFLERGESPVADTCNDCLGAFKNDFKWLPTEVLDFELNELIGDHQDREPYSMFMLKVADMLFTRVIFQP